MGQRSDFLIRHLQELGVDVSGTLPFLVEQELVVAAVSTNGCSAERGRDKREKCQSANTDQTQRTRGIWFL